MSLGAWDSFISVERVGAHERETVRDAIRNSPYWANKTYTDAEVDGCLADATGFYWLKLSGGAAAVAAFEDRPAFDGPKRAKRRLTLLFNLIDRTVEGHGPIYPMLSFLRGAAPTDTELQLVVPDRAKWLHADLPTSWRLLGSGVAHRVYIAF